VSAKGKITEIAKRPYNRIASFYDLTESLIESSLYNKWRELLWSKVEGTHILEVGVGTGKNFRYYPPDAEITAIDFSEEMLKRAKDRARRQKTKARQGQGQEAED